tara:strand:+ start:39 stop:365 length:327 start_codon:yes stop_codon:yes gene_type:complete
MRDLQQMRTIHNNELEPITPLGADGNWAWNGDIITSAGVDSNGEPFQRKGMWVWLAKQERRQAPLRKATVRQVVLAHRPDHKIDLALKSIAVLACITMAITFILLAAV